MLIIAPTSSAVIFGPVEDSATGEEGGERSGGRDGEGGEGGEEGGEGTGQQSAEPQPVSKQDCWQNGPCRDVPSIHACFEQALSNNNRTPRLDSFRQSLHVSPPTLIIDLGGTSSHFLQNERGGGKGGVRRQPALKLDVNVPEES